VLLTIVLVIVVVTAGAAGPVCASTTVNGVAVTVVISAKMYIVIIEIVFVDFLIVIFLSSLLYAYYDLTRPFRVLFPLAVAGIYCTIKRSSSDRDGGGISLEWVEQYPRLELYLKLKGEGL
jgi:hypothetical protein